MSSIGYDPLTGLPKTKSGKRPSAILPPEDIAAIGGAPYPNYDFLRPVAGAGIGGRPGQVTIPGFTPDYESLVRNDPGYSQFLKDLDAEGISDAGQRNSAIQRALIQFGLVPDLDAASKKLGIGLPSDLDLSTTRALAEKNTEAKLSTVGRLQQERQRAERMLRNVLASRGALRSGELSHGLREQQQGFTAATYDAEQQLLDYLSGVSAAFAKAQADRARARGGAASEAASRQLGLPQNQPTADQLAQFSHTDQTGVPVYTSGGNTYTIGPDGNAVPYTPPAPAADLVDTPPAPVVGPTQLRSPGGFGYRAQ